MCCKWADTKSVTEKTTEGLRGEGQKRQREFSKIPLKIN
jgi:hypothetical protein